MTAVHTALDIRPAYEPKSYAEIVAEAAARRKRLFSPRCAPQKLSEAKPKPRLVWVQKASDERPLWQREEIRFDAHEEFFPAWQKNRVVAYVMAHSKCLGWTMEEMIGPGRMHPLVTDRQALMAEVWQIFRPTLPQIGKIFGGRDNSTVTHALRKHGIKSVAKPTIDHFEEDIKRHWEMGMRHEDIAYKVGYSRQAIQNYLAQRPWYIKGGQRKVAKDHAEQILAMAREGFTCREIADRFGFVTDTIYRLCKRCGVEVRINPRNVASDHSDVVKAMFKAGASYRAIGEQIGLKREAVRKFIKSMGWTR